MKQAFFLLAAMLPLSLLGQKYIDRSKAEVKTLLQKEIGNSSPLVNLVETDSTIVLSPESNDDGKQVTHIYGFDSEGKCNFERINSTCRECFEKYLQELITKPDHQWKKINENQYVSKFADKMLLEISPTANEYYFTIFKANWTKEMYDMLKDN